jgi:hypothetical protein
VPIKLAVKPHEARYITKTGPAAFAIISLPRKAPITAAKASGKGCKSSGILLSLIHYKSKRIRSKEADE